MEENEYTKQKKILIDLQNEGLLNEEEYQSKLKAILEKEETERIKQEEDQLDKRILFEIENHKQKLDSLLKSGLLTQQEYESKRSELYPAMKKRILELDERKEKDSDAKTILIFIAIIFTVIAVIIGIADSIDESEALPAIDKNITNQAGGDSIPDTYTFSYNGMSMGELNGAELGSLKNVTIAGKIEFSKNEIKLISEESTESFQIDKHEVAPNGDMYGSHLFMTHNNKNEKFNISVTTRSGVNVVTVHYISIGMMSIFFINEGFTTDLQIYE